MAWPLAERLVLVPSTSPSPFPHREPRHGFPAAPLGRRRALPFPPKEREAADATVARGGEGLPIWIRLGAGTPMGEIHRRDLDPPPDPA